MNRKPDTRRPATTQQADVARLRADLATFRRELAEVRALLQRHAALREEMREIRRSCERSCERHLAELSPDDAVQVRRILLYGH